MTNPDPMNIVIAKQGVQHGPFTREVLQARLLAGEFLPTDVGWYEGLPVWLPLGCIMSGTAPGREAGPPSLGASPVLVRQASGYAGFWLRAVALVIDVTVLGIPLGLLQWPVTMSAALLAP